MKTMCPPIVVIVFGMFLAACALTAPAKAATVYRYSGHGAAVYFSGADKSGCIYTNIFVEFGEATAGNPPRPSQQPILAYMYIMQWDNCNGVYLRNGQTDPPALLPEGAVHVAPNLQSASLNATVELIAQDQTLPPFTADISLIWTATGELPTRIIDRVHYQSPLGFNNADTRSVSRPAKASGSMLV